jgi:hypothetical protein
VAGWLVADKPNEQGERSNKRAHTFYVFFLNENILRLNTEFIEEKGHVSRQNFPQYHECCVKYLQSTICTAERIVESTDLIVSKQW